MSKYPGLKYDLRDTREEAKERQDAERSEREDPAYLKKVRDLPCSICGKRGPNDAHHWPKKRKNGKGWSDTSVIPLCRGCHTVKPDSFHRLVGSLRTWENHHGVSIKDLIAKTQALVAASSAKGE